tara:strand:+ start:4217 stop:4870 length:654 start_codon:yes stop_codon:yes gene_type:complete
MEMVNLPPLNIRFNANFMLLLVVIGITIKLFFGQSISEDGLSGPANAVIWGYGGAFIGIICLIFIILAFYDAATMKDLSNKSVYESGKNVISKILENGYINDDKKFFPIIISLVLFLVILLWTILLNVKYYKQINQGRVSLSYLNAVYMSTILLIFQVIVLFRLVYSLFNYTFGKSKRDEENTTSRRMVFFTYLISLVNVILLGTASIDLIYFSTDG